MKKRKFADGGETTDYTDDPDSYGKAIAAGRDADIQTDSASKTTPTKPRVVSKKELADSGLSLRDFLNKERGLTRRKDSSSDSTSAPAADSAPAKRPSMMQRFKADNAKVEAAARSKASDEGADDAMNAATKVPRVTSDKSDPAYGNGRVNPKTLLPYKKGGDVKKYAKGGSIDGIAQRGKTRGKVV